MVNGVDHLGAVVDTSCSTTLTIGDHRCPCFPPPPIPPTLGTTRFTSLATLPRRRRDRRLAGGDRPRHAPPPLADARGGLRGAGGDRQRDARRRHGRGPRRRRHRRAARRGVLAGQRRRRAAAPAVPAGRRPGPHRRGRHLHPRGPSDLTGPAGPAVRHGLPRPDRRPARAAAPARWHDVRPAYGFVLLAARDGPTSATALAGLMGVSKQAASKLVDAMAAAAT